MHHAAMYLLVGLSVSKLLVNFLERLDHSGNFLALGTHIPFKHGRENLVGLVVQQRSENLDSGLHGHVIFCLRSTKQLTVLLLFFFTLDFKKIVPKERLRLLCLEQHIDTCSNVGNLQSLASHLSHQPRLILSVQFGYFHPKTFRECTPLHHLLRHWNETSQG